MSTDSLDTAEPRFPTGVVLSLAAALVLSVLVLRALPSASGSAPRLRSEPAQASRAVQLTSVPIPSATRTARLPALPTPERTMFASVQEAGQRLGLPVRDPRVLPQGLFPLAVGWQAAGPVTVPGQVPPGRLLAWYYSLRDGVSLILEQGQGVGVAPGKAPAGAHGTLTLPDGTSLAWVRGHLNLTQGPLGLIEEWLGDELMVGVPAGPGVGWRLISSVYPLDELVRVAEELR